MIGNLISFALGAAAMLAFSLYYKSKFLKLQTETADEIAKRNAP